MSIFRNISADPIVAAEIMEALDIDMDELSSPIHLKRLEEIVSFLAPYENRMMVLSKLTGAKPGLDKVSHVLEYIRLRKDRQQKVDEIDALSQTMDSSDETNALILLKTKQVAQLEGQIEKFE